MEIERSINCIELNYQELLQRIQPAFPHCQQFDAWEPLRGGALNTIYKITIGDESFILRLYARDRAHCKTEKMIHQLIDNKVTTPKLIYADEDHEPWAYSLFEFIPGPHIHQLAIEKTSLSYELGRVLASIHAFKFPNAGLFGDGMSIGYPFQKGSSPYYEEALSILSKETHIKKRLGEKLFEQVLEFIQKHKACFPIVDDHVCLTHSDFKPVNLLYHTGKVFVLDWEFAHAGIGILDFSILLRHRSQFPLDITSLTTGYTDFGGTLEDDWFRTALITDFVNTLALLESPSERPKLFLELTNTIQDTIKGWEESNDYTPS